MAGSAHHILDLPRFDSAPRILIVCAPYYREIADGLVAGAEAVLARAGAITARLDVPGALEIPPAIAMAAKSRRYDGYVALGCVIRGETTHYDTVCNDSSRGLMLLGLEGHAIGNGILTVENMAQAQARANPADMDKGGGAAAAALHLVALSRKYAAQPSARSTNAAEDAAIRLAGHSKGSDIA